MKRFYKDFYTNKGLFECLYETQNDKDFYLTIKAPTKKANRFWFINLDLKNGIIEQLNHKEDIDLSFLFDEILSYTNQE